MTEATYTSTVTDAADGIVTLFSGTDGQISTYGANTIYEIYIYTTTQAVDIVGQTLDCGPGPAPGSPWNRKNATIARREPLAAAPRNLPAAVIAIPTSGS